MQLYAIITEFLKKERSHVVRILWLNFGANVCALLLPLLISQMYANLLEFDSARAEVFSKITPQYEQVYESFFMLLGLFVVILVGRFYLDFQRKNRQGLLTEAFQHDLRQKLFAHHLKMDIATYETHGIGRFLMRFSGELSAIHNFWTKGLLQFFADALLLILGFGLIVYLNAVIAGVVSAILIASFFVFRFLNRKIGNIEQVRRSKKSQLLAFFSTRLLAVSTIQAHNRETMEVQKFEKISDRVRTEGNDFQRWQALNDAAVPTALYLTMGIALVFIFLNKTYNVATVDVPRILAIILIMLSWRQPLMRVFQVGLVWKKGKLSLASLNRLLERPLTPNSDLPEIKLIPSVLHIENVGFEDNKSHIFKALNIKIKKHDLQVLESQHTHAWVKILAGLQPHTEGVIRLGDAQISQQNPRSVRRHLAFSSPTFPLYGKTIIDAISNSNKPEERTKAKEMLNSWVAHFPALREIRSDSPFHENGGTLSAAQLQLLRLLRAILTRKAFLVLEEPLAHLDAESASKVWTLIEKEKQNRAVLILTNRASLYVVRIGERY